MLLLLVGGLVFLVFVDREEVPLGDDAPWQLFGTWEAADGPHEGRSLVLQRALVILMDGSKTIERAPLLGVFEAEPTGDLATYRVEYGDPNDPQTLQVMLDLKGDLRLANRPDSRWMRSTQP